MKKIGFIGLMVILVLWGANTAWGQEKYFGVGGSYAISDIDLKSDLVSGSLDDTYGFNLKAGTHLGQFFSFEFNFDYVPEFKWDGTVVVADDPVQSELETDVMTFMLDFKASPEFREKTYRPFVLAGLGWMDSSGSARTDINGDVRKKSIDNSDFCAELGLGIDFFFSPNFALGLEGSYVFGFGNVEDIKYTQITLGFTYFFFAPWWL